MCCIICFNKQYFYVYNSKTHIIIKLFSLRSGIRMQKKYNQKINTPCARLLVDIIKETK
ncbi:hypothetical protein A1OE_58 [Candidatus Endolissoclinum faulkneri L2]|uniref:Uncharacterized protein n=1 Tax=Candidatus Endolissoclinum faulkneri L2 TaxID=1193729 RepID=K7YLA6_9PROT|nr:hypothetical protein A1OE_58 [Candidatus Endolissoclinum faulkneri L2]